MLMQMSIYWQTVAKELLGLYFFKNPITQGWVNILKYFVYFKQCSVIEYCYEKAGSLFELGIKTTTSLITSLYVEAFFRALRIYFKFLQ